jgi:preprotein translocase subunit SecY
MSLLRNHMVLMFIYAVATALFFTLLSSKSERREQVRFFLLVFLALFVGGMVVAWLMFPFPLKR